MRGSLRVAALAQVEDTEAGECLGGGVAHVARGEAGLAVDSDRLGVVAATVEVAEQGGGQAGGWRENAGPPVPLAGEQPVHRDGGGVQVVVDYRDTVCLMQSRVMQRTAEALRRRDLHRPLAQTLRAYAR